MPPLAPGPVRYERDRHLPAYVQEEFVSYLKCGRLEHGFLRVRCTTCHAERLVAFSCKRRGFCPSCGGRRMTESAALLVDEVLPAEPIRQWVLSVCTPGSQRVQPCEFGARLLFPRPANTGSEFAASHSRH